MVLHDRYKRPMDLTILVLVHLVLLPLWALLWTVLPLVVWLGDRGPVFYRQQRSGKDGRPFTVVKFRTMIVGANKHGPPWTLEGDPRITRVGRVLRWTALDELPAVLSIAKGDMSLVGPRAIPVEEQREIEQRLPGFADRLRVRPGLAGLAQIRDRTDDDMTKLHYDREYMRRMSPWLDLKLLFISVVFTLTGRWDKRSGKAPTK